MCIPHSVAFVFSTLEPFRTRNPEGASTPSPFSYLEASEDSKALENKKTLSVKAKYPNMSTKPTRYTYLLD